MKASRVIILAVLLLGLGTAGYCTVGLGMMQLEFGVTARSLGMGGTGVAVADYAGVGMFNPSGLPWAAPAPGHEGNLLERALPWHFQVVGSAAVSGDLNLRNVCAAATDDQGINGISAWWNRIDTGAPNVWGGAYGRRFGNWSLGASMAHLGSPADETVWNAGGLYAWDLPAMGRITLGLTAVDLTGESPFGPWYNVGICVPIAHRGLVALDVIDVTDKSDGGRALNIGAEFALYQGLVARAGRLDLGVDTCETLGLGYKQGTWCLDAAWVNLPSGADGDMWVAGASFGF